MAHSDFPTGATEAVRLEARDAGPLRRGSESKQRALPCSNILHTKASAQGSMLPMWTFRPSFVGKCEEGAEGPLWKEEDRK